MRKGLRIAGLLFALAALVCAASAAAQTPPEETAAPEEYAVVVGDVRFPRDLVQFSLNSFIDSFLMQGGERHARGRAPAAGRDGRALRAAGRHRQQAARARP